MSAAAPSENVDQASAVHAQPVARLVRVEDCIWGKGAEPPKTGKELEIGQQLRLDAGFVELSYRKGVNMVLQGPALLSLDSDSQVFLQEGRSARA